MQERWLDITARAWPELHQSLQFLAAIQGGKRFVLKWYSGTSGHREGSERNATRVEGSTQRKEKLWNDVCIHNREHCRRKN